MRNLRNPKWLLIINTLPLVVLFFLLFGQLTVIKSLLGEQSIRFWKYLGLLSGGLGILNFVYTIYLIFTKKKVSVWYGVIALILYIALIYFYGYNLDDIIPFNVPRWMISGNIFLYFGTFIMPTLAYSLFILVLHFTRENKEYKAWVNFLIATGIPILVYLFVQIILPLWQQFNIRLSEHSILVLFISITLAFLFFFVRGMLILVNEEAETLRKYQLSWKILIAIVLPIVGLLINNGYLFNRFSPSETGIFGDFSNYWFFIIAVINGILLCLPNIEKKTYRLLLFAGRSITFSYTLYFFLVFLPFLPLSVIAIIVVGLGFLMLTPLVLFVIHISELSKDFSYLKTLFSKNLIVLVSVLGFLVIPVIITLNYLKDRSILNKTLTYLYSPDYSKQYKINKKSLKSTLNTIKSNKRNWDFDEVIFNTKTPYLSSYFNWLVMDNLTLSDAKIYTIGNIFFGYKKPKKQNDNIRNNNVKITNISTKSTYDKAQNAWKTWVDLEITNNNESGRFSEYATTINLPVGCWISDYYLYVGYKKEPGILSEKKAAMWIFSQIRNRNRDPGILYYLTGNKVAFRVFPFRKGEVRKTGIEFLHKEPVKLNIDGNVVELGNQEQAVCENIETENVVYLSSKYKQKLKTVKRKPYFHFLIDISSGQGMFTNRIEQFLSTNKAFAENAKISFVNAYVNTIKLDNQWKEQYKNLKFDGGFYLDRAIRKVLFDAYREKTKTYPVIVVLTGDMKNAFLDKDFSDFRFAFPESNLFFNLEANGELQAHSLIENPIRQLADKQGEPLSCDSVLEYKLPDNSVVYLPNDNEASIVLKKDIFKISESDIKEKNWQSALNMQGAWISQILHPEIADREWLNLLKYSFLSKVMTPVTSYLVVENEAQKEMLKKKQKQTLSGNRSLDIGNEARRMSEPSLFLLAILFVLILWIINKRKQYRT